MKNQYVADVNDYNKYLLIKELSAYYRDIDICWMLTIDDNRQDGRKVSYLFDETKRQDRDIYDYLRSLVIAGIKDVKAIEQGCILPVRKYYDSLYDIDFNDIPELIFLDPDNGIEVKSTPPGKDSSEKYVYFNDIRIILKAGSDLLIYQHYPRVNRTDYQKTRESEIIKNCGNVDVTHYDRGMVDFILIKTQG